MHQHRKRRNVITGVPKFALPTAMNLPHVGCMQHAWSLTAGCTHDHHHVPVLTASDLAWRSRFVRRQSGTREVLVSNLKYGIGAKVQFVAVRPEARTWPNTHILRWFDARPTTNGSSADATEPERTRTKGMLGSFMLLRTRPLLSAQGAVVVAIVQRNPGRPAVHGNPPLISDNARNLAKPDRSSFGAAALHGADDTVVTPRPSLQATRACAAYSLFAVRKRFVSLLQRIIHNLQCMACWLDHLTVNAITAPYQPPRSIDLNPLNLFYSWGHLKALVYATRADDVDILCNRFVVGCQTIRNTLKDSSTYPHCKPVSLQHPVLVVLDCRLGTGGRNKVTVSAKVALTKRLHLFACYSSPLWFRRHLTRSSEPMKPGSIPGRATPGFSALLFPPPLHSGAAPFSPHFTLIGPQYLVVKSRQNLSTQQFRADEGEMRPLRKPTDQRRHLARFPHTKIRGGGPARNRTRYALVGSKQRTLRKSNSPEVKVPVYLPLRPEKRGIDKVDTVARAPSTPSPNKRKALNWCAVFSSHCRFEKAVCGHFGVLRNAVYNVADALRVLNSPRVKYVLFSETSAHWTHDQLFRGETSPSDTVQRSSYGTSDSATKQEGEGLGTARTHAELGAALGRLAPPLADEKTAAGDSKSCQSAFRANAINSQGADGVKEDQLLILLRCNVRLRRRLKGQRDLPRFQSLPKTTREQLDMSNHQNFYYESSRY
ncbi:hypothetical protein PR048_028055 [Dryococelus australis]|uniref:Uncharacterized protein n=1 Tax=Dryococelus australis TaxID=614101 RepID=A0ABQ9GI90_9NEOP|nr:hypothetical protein PR048_028055 [Dryococelus australis]